MSPPQNSLKSSVTRSEFRSRAATRAARPSLEAREPPASSIRADRAGRYAPERSARGTRSAFYRSTAVAWDNLGDEQETLTERCEIQMPYILYVYKQIVIQSETNNQIAKQTPYPELRLAVWLWTIKKNTELRTG